MDIFKQIQAVLESLGLWKPALIGLNIFIPTLAMSYLFDKMLSITKTPRGRNIVAFVTCFACSYLTFFYNTYDLFWKIWTPYFSGCVGILFYVLIGFSLYDRVDALFDRISKNKEVRKVEKANRKNNKK